MYRLSFRLLSWLLLLLVLSIGCSVVSFADDVVETFVDNNGLFCTGYLRYIYSDWGTPSQSLDDGRLHTLTFCSESERNLVISPTLANVSRSDLMGYIDYFISFTFPMAQRLQVRQVHRSGSQSRESTAYYEVVVDEIETSLLWRSQGSSSRIIFISSGLFLISAFIMVKRCCFD